MISPTRANVCVVGCGRTGSTLLFSLLEQVPHVLVTKPKEFLNVRGTEPDRYSSTQCAALAEFATCNPGMAVFTHLKLHSPALQIDRRATTIEDMLARVETAGFAKFVHIRRRNALRIWLSIVRGWLGEPRVLFNRGQLSEEELRFLSHVDPAQCVAFIDQLERATAEIDRQLSSRRHVDIVYEEHLAGDPRLALAQLATIECLEVPADLAIAYKVTNPWPVRESIENVDEIQAALDVTKHAWMLEE